MKIFLFLIFSIFLVSCGGSKTKKLSTRKCPSHHEISNGDPTSGCSWHLNNVGQTSFAQKGGTAGFDMNMKVSGLSYKGRGVRIAIADTGLDVSHEDLKDNILIGENRNYYLPAPHLGDPGFRDSRGDHGTSIAGIIAARDHNNLGIRGIAPRSSIAMFNLLSSNQTSAMSLDSLQGNFDIFNQSWGINIDGGNKNLEPGYRDALKSGVTNLRGGKGALYVKASGNDFASGVNSNMDPFNSTPYTFVIAAFNASGKSSSYSQGGSCNLISAPGGEFGEKYPAIITTDLSGCSIGYARSKNNKAANYFEKGGEYNPYCNYTSTFNGTSSATAMVSGAIAVILEANPNLTWRDIRHILITTARPLELALPNIKFNPAGEVSRDLPLEVPAGYTWEQSWITNGAGHKFHNWFGFGAIDVDAAVNKARNYNDDLQIYMESVKTDPNDSNKKIWAYSKTIADPSTNGAIPDNDANGFTDILTIPNTHNLTIENVQIKVNITHPYSGDIALELTSPAGTKSILLNANNAFKNNANLDNMVLLSNAFYGENSQGAWTLRVVDAKAGDTGHLEDWSLKINGHGQAAIDFNQ